MQEENQSLIAALKESEARLQAIISTAVDGIITISTRGVIQTINSSALEMFQYTEKEVIGKSVSILMPEPDSSRHDSYIENYHQTGVGKIIGIGRQVEGKRKDGSTFPFRLSISKVELDGGTIFTGIVHDISEQVAAEQNLLRLNESLEEIVDERTGELERINTSLQEEIVKRERKEMEVRSLLEKERELGLLKSRFVSMASHEFRTPLTGIQSAATLIDRYDAADQAPNRKKLTDMVRTSVRNLTNILNDFLSMDKLHSGKVTTHPSDFAIEELLEEILAELEGSLSDGKSIQPFLSDRPLLVFLDRNIMKNVLLNLLSNAIKYSRSNSEIKIRVESEKEGLSITVQDEGIGIPEAEQKHMFERFFRAQNATNIKGTGLGLNIVKRYLDLMEGDIRFESQENVGTTFFITIPQQKIEQEL
jgi:PAS domain S-box-containing protein